MSNVLAFTNWIINEFSFKKKDLEIILEPEDTEKPSEEAKE